MLASDYGLREARPIITKPPPAGDMLYMFESGARYYFWNAVEDSVTRVDGPTTLEDIFASMDKFGLEELRLSDVQPLSG
jgi:hypothetical protein